MTPALEPLRSHLNASVPFARHAGVTIETIDDGAATAAIEETPDSINHIATQHAGALFTVGEAASGAAMASAFAGQLLAIRPVAKDAKISFLKLARGRIEARARARIAGEALRAALAEEGKVSFAVDVDLFDASEEKVAALDVVWHVRRLS